MSMEYKPMTQAERLYTYKQSHQLVMQTGAIGYLRGDFGKNGAEFYSSFFDLMESLKTDAFRTDIDTVVNAMRETGGPLRDRYAMASFCGLRESAAFKGNIGTEYAFRVDTAQFSYMMRCNPSPHDYNFYIWCYQRTSLEMHMASAQRGIRFITPDYREKFRIQDSDQIRIRYADGESKDQRCRFIDDYHLEFGNGLYHICEFAERMERSGATIIPLRSSLPEKCFAALETSEEMVLIERGEPGYTHSGMFPEGQEKHEAADALNDAMGVTKAQAAAMLAGSMFGWDAPAADPKNYDEKGTPLRNGDWNRGDR